MSQPIAALRTTLRILAFCLAFSLFAQSSGRQIFNVADYGAARDGSSLATDAFRKAIQAAKAAGGGTIYVPPGKYRSGPIELFSNMTLEVDAGAAIEFPVAPLPFTRGRYLGIETLMPMPLIGAHNAENVAVTGRGLLTTGDYEQWRKAYRETYEAYLKAHHGVVSTGGSESESANGPNWDRLLRDLEAGGPISGQEYLDAAPELRPSFLSFMHTKNVLVSGLRIIGAPMFVVHLLYTENAAVHDLIIETFPGPHTNGIAVDSSRFVRISDNYIDTGDDGIVLKSGKDSDGRRVNRPTEDVTITNCTVHHAHGAVVIGSETAGGIRNVTAANITAVDTENGIRIKSRRGRGGTVEDLRFDNFTMRDVGTGIVVTTYYVMGGEKASAGEPVSERTPAFRNIGISHVTIHGSKKLVDIDGLPEMPIAQLRLTDVTGSGKTGLTARYTDLLELRHILLNADSGPVFSIESARNLEMEGLTSSKPSAGAPVIRLRQSPGAVLRNSHAYPGSGVFLSTGSGELQTIRREGNLLDGAKTPAEERP